MYVSGRWHTKGHQVVYLAPNPATSLLESIVHMEIDEEDRPTTYQALKIEGPDDVSREVLRPGAGSLPENWSSDITITQAFGDAWLEEKRSLLLEVPSVLIPETSNVLFNPLHPEAGSFHIVAVYRHAFDPRLF